MKYSRHEEIHAYNAYAIFVLTMKVNILRQGKQYEGVVMRRVVQSEDYEQQYKKKNI